MNTRRFSLIASLLLTGALIAALPWLWGLRETRARTETRLKPPETRTLTVWLMSDDINDRKLINELCAAFEKGREGVRVFLRRVDAGELNDWGGVPPDVALYSTGDLQSPRDKMIRLDAPEGMRASLAGAGTSAGGQYGLPLWHEASVLVFPYAWQSAEAAPTPRSDSLLGLGTPAPSGGEQPFIEADALPWRELLKPEALARPKGAEWQQLLYVCPQSIRAELAQALASAPADAPAKVVGFSRVMNEPSLCRFPLEPAVAHSVRMCSLAQDGEDARAFIRWLLSEEAQEQALLGGLIPALPPAEVADAALSELARRYSGETLAVNAFEHTKQELIALCEDGFRRLEDPTLTLIKLR